ncbi:MAG: CoA transferase [Nevskia sp.]|nr:CoA transferase [Nevskia sp.]
MPQEHLLTGIRVLDLSRVLAGPTCTRLFAEMGADVIKVESAPNGDMARAVSRIRNGRSLYMVQQHLNKKSLCVDFRTAEGIGLVRELVPHCDVVVENFRPGMMAKMGLAYEDLKKLRKDIILCSISALGQTGPLSSKPGYDTIAQAYSGVTSMIGEKDQPPYIPLVGLGDVSTGAHAAFAVAAALLHRARTGRGQFLDIALLDCYYHYHEAGVHQFSGSNGQFKPTRTGRHFSYVSPCGVFRANGGSIVIIAYLHHWKDMAKALGRPELADHPEYATDQVRCERREHIVELIENWLATFPDVDSAVAALERHDIPCAPVLSVEQTVTHPHHVQRGTVRTVNDPYAGTFQIPGMPIKTSDYPAHNPDYIAPRLGEHNRLVLQELLGKTDAQIDAWSKSGVLCEGEF